MPKRTTPPSRTGHTAKLALCCLLFVCLVLGHGCRCDKNDGKDSDSKAETLILNDGKDSHTKPGTTILNDGKDSHTKPGTLILNDGKDSDSKAKIRLPVPIGGSPPTVAVCMWPSRKRKDRPRFDPDYLDPRIIVAIWKDGRVIWSEADDALLGGPPYFEGTIDPQILAEFLAQVDNKGWFNDPVSRRHNVGFDASRTSITILGDGGKLLNMGSWHELFEANPNLVDEAKGITSLDGRDRAQVLAEQPEDHRRFRAIWSELRNHLQELIPADGKVVEGLQFEDLLIEVGEAR